MIAPTQIRKPENWQDFEILCKKLWGEIWDCSDTIQRNGRSGQNQHGVDVYGIPKGESSYYGIQCKGKDEYTHSQLTVQEVDQEIIKAKTFAPALKRLIFATTANKDANIEAYIRTKNIESLQEGGFEIYLSSWEDIVDLLIERKRTFDWYINHCQYVEKLNLEVSFNGHTTLTIRPQYVRINHITKVLPPYNPANPQDRLAMLMEKYNLDSTSSNLIKQQQFINERLYGISSKTDYTICYPTITIKNIGTTTIEDYKLDIWLDNTDFVGDCFHYVNATMLDPAERAAINARKDQEREVYKSKEYSNEVFFIPKNRILVPNDTTSFKFSVIPSENVSFIILHWKLLSRNGVLKGENAIRVLPHYIDREIITKTRDPKDYREEYITIEPRIE